MFGFSDDKTGLRVFAHYALSFYIILFMKYLAPRLKITRYPQYTLRLNCLTVFNLNTIIVIIVVVIL